MATDEHEMFFCGPLLGGRMTRGKSAVRSRLLAAESQM